MGSAEKFCLRWNDFETNISSAFKQLREDKEFFDVTLACDDDQIEAHKVILSACSPFFRTILKRNRHQHPLLYLKGIKYTDLVAVLNFMYHGEVNVAQDDLNSFLALAEDLKIKGLTQNNSTNQDQENVKKDHIREASPPPNPRIRKPPDLSETSTPQKRLKIGHPPKPVQTKQEVDYDEVYVQVATPVKFEPGTVINDPILTQSASNHDYRQTLSSHSNQIVDTNLDNSLFDESYNEYDNYGEGSGENYTEAEATNPDENKGNYTILYVCVYLFLVV